MRTTLRQVLLLAEVVVLFGPATILLGASPLAILDALESPLGAASIVSLLTIAGGFGLIAVIRFVLHTLDPDESLPPLSHYLGALVVGVTGCVGALAYFGLSLGSALIFGSPVVGAMHLAWLAQGEVSHAT